MRSHAALAERLAGTRRFDQLIALLRDELDWPIGSDDFEDLTFEYDAEELGIDRKNAAKIEEIKRLRPLVPNQPWGIFFVKFEPKRLPVVALRRILGAVAIKKRASANNAERTAWAPDDLLFVSNYGEGEERQINFAHFARAQDGHDLPTLKVLGWDSQDTVLHLDAVARELRENLAWPDNDLDAEVWRTRWRSAFTLVHREAITTSKDLSIRLARLARAIRARIRTVLMIETDMGPLTRLMRGFQDALVHDLDADGFADMYAQTIAYGLLSARIADPQKKTADDLAAHMRTSPFLRELMETFLSVGGRQGKAGESGIDFDELGVSEVVQLLDSANMEAVVLDFGDRNRQEDPVLHFYELFLSEYDSQRRMQRGVFYTPRPLVSHMVRSVHNRLRTDFGLEDGLADTSTWGDVVSRGGTLEMPLGVAPEQEFVQILDPAVGTGTFLVEIIEVIYETLCAKWQSEGASSAEVDARWNEYVPRHLLTRLYGFELMMAPYAIAHLKISLKLHETGYRFQSDERARVFLTNALEGANQDVSQMALMLPALATEASDVQAVKRKATFTVLLGNPPYSIASANLEVEHRNLVEPYRYVDGIRIRERGALAFERNIQDDYVKFFAVSEQYLKAASAGVLALVTNSNYLDAATFRGLRASLLSTFPDCLIVDCHGDGSGRHLPGAEGADENLFDILQGVAIGYWQRGGSPAPRRRFAELGGTRAAKFAALSSLTSDGLLTKEIWPKAPNYEIWAAPLEASAWDDWQPLPEIFRQFSAGVLTARDQVVVANDPSVLATRIEEMRTSTSSDSAFLEEFHIPDKKGWSVGTARAQLAGLQSVEEHILPIAYRPFDMRHIFYHPSLVWGRAYPTMRHALETDNVVLAVCRQLRTRSDEWCHAFVTTGLGVSGLVSNRSKEVTSFFPLLVVESGEGEDQLFKGLPALNVLDPDIFPLAFSGGAGSSARDLIAGYTYAILYSPEYRRKYRTQLARGFPHIPTRPPESLFRALCALGQTLIGLHCMNAGSPPLESARFIGDFATTPVGAIVRENDVVWLGNQRQAGVEGVPDGVWRFRIGSYQVCEKWLKDRRGCVLSDGEQKHYLRIAGAIEATLGVMAEIDAVIKEHGGWPDAFSQ